MNRILLFAILSLAMLHSASAAVIYSGIQNITIPTTFDGVYVDIDNGATSASTIVGWDVNIIFGGVGIGGSAAFQPARDGTGVMDTVLNYALNDLIDGSLLYAGAVETGSSDHLGLAPTQFQDGSEGYLGFKFTKNDSSGPYYGWMRMTLTANTAGALIHDWAWEDSGAGILAGALVPEPGRAMLVLLGFCALALRRRRLRSGDVMSRSGGTHTFSVPVGANTRLFMRLTVSGQ